MYTHTYTQARTHTHTETETARQQSSCGGLTVAGAAGCDLRSVELFIAATPTTKVTDGQTDSRRPASLAGRPTDRQNESQTDKGTGRQGDRETGRQGCRKTPRLC